ncbi:MAG: LysR substrate-binding domain-containing protein [Schleiferiaceae bacterium]
MTITQLQYIVAVDNYRHFAKAAEACHVTQPTLSMQIHKLEEELGVLLFDRSKQPVKPTDLGQKIIEQARTIINESEKVFQLTQEATGHFEGTFKLGIIPTISPFLLPRFAKKISAKMPDVEIVIEELQTEQIIEKLRKDQLDAGILATPLDEQSIVERPVYYEPFTAYVPQGHRLANEEFILNSELSPDDMLLLNEGHCFRNSVLNLCGKPGVTAHSNIQFESGQFDTLIKLADNGFGMTLIPYLAALDLEGEHRGHVKPIADPKPTREISLVYSRTQLKINLIETLANIIQSSIPEKLLEKSKDIVSPV